MNSPSRGGGGKLAAPHQGCWATQSRILTTGPRAAPCPRDKPSAAPIAQHCSWGGGATGPGQEVAPPNPSLAPGAAQEGGCQGSPILPPALPKHSTNTNPTGGTGRECRTTRRKSWGRGAGCCAPGGLWGSPCVGRGSCRSRLTLMQTVRREVGSTGGERRRLLS